MFCISKRPKKKCSTKLLSQKMYMHFYLQCSMTPALCSWTSQLTQHHSHSSQRTARNTPTIAASECAACRGALLSVCTHMFSAQELDGNQHHQLQKQDEQKKANNPNGKRHTSLDFSQLPHRPPHHPARLQTEPIKNYRGQRAGTKEDRAQAQAQSKHNPEW